MSPLGMFAGIIAIVGALNWGLVGLFNFNLIRSLFGPMSIFSRVIYTLVGFSGLYLIFSSFYVMRQREHSRFGRMAWWRR